MGVKKRIRVTGCIIFIFLFFFSAQDILRLPAAFKQVNEVNAVFFAGNNRYLYVKVDSEDVTGSVLSKGISRGYLAMAAASAAQSR